MKQWRVLMVFCTFILFLSVSVYATNTEMETLYNELRQLDFDTTRIAEVKDITFHRDIANFYLEEGTIYFLKPISFNGKDYVTGALFIGDGTFSFRPPTRIEREQLARFYKKELSENLTFEKEFNVLSLRFADTTFTELEKKLTFHTGSIKQNVMDELDNCNNYIFEERNIDIFPHLIGSLTSALGDGYFYAHIGERDREPVFFTCNPYFVEEIEFAKRLSKLNYVQETINQFHKRKDYVDRINLEEESKDCINIKDYQMDARIETGGDFSAKVNIGFDVVKNRVDVIVLIIAPKLKIDKVLDDNGTPLSFIKEDKSAELIIFPERSLTKGEKVNIFISYNGDVVENIYGNFYIKSPGLWYPRYGWLSRTSYDLTFKTPKQYEFVSIGKKVEDRKEGNYRITRWVQETPIQSASFNIGLFKTYDINLKGIPPITVLMSEVGRIEIAHYLASKGISIGKHMEKQVGADIANSIQLFQHLFGPYPCEKIYVSQIPYTYGEAFPGFIHLPWDNFQISEIWGEEEIFRAHEVAHQWWGVTVGVKTYHDMWLAEGFAEYSALWYMQWVKKDTKRFFQILDGWKNKILSNRKYILGSGAEAGPIWLGYRTSSSKTRGDYSLIVYKKGAYVLHMLRNMLMDLKTMNDDRFTDMLQDFYNTYKGKDASTEDFKHIVEKHCGEDMDWFFNQWIYGTDIPTYKFSYYTSEKPDGKYIIHCRVIQENVPDDFKMYVPITIKFKGNKSVCLRITVNKPTVELSFPSPMKPEKIIFNDFNSVLAKVKYVKYEK